MAGRIPPTKAEITATIKAYLGKHDGIACEYKQDDDCYELTDANGKGAIVGPGWQCNDEGLFNELREILMAQRESTSPPEPTRGAKMAEPHPAKANMPAPVRNGSNGAMMKPGMQVRDIQVAELTFDDIKTYICPTANDQEIMIFLKLCQARNLNPFLRDAYLIKYDQTKPAQMVVGKDSFTKKAEDHPRFDGYKAGIIVRANDALDYREGTFLVKGEDLLGGWAEVYRVDRKATPYKMAVSLNEYNTGKSNWVSKPATMIRKVALVQALREAFPSEFSGMYDQAEMGLDPENEVAEA